MSNQLYRSFSEPQRTNLSWQERWEREDRGLISCWETGRALRARDPDLAARAEKGELPSLNWKGGIKKETKITEKVGTLHYLAKWQGLRGEDLNIDLDDERVIVCSRTGVAVTFTGDQSKYANA